MFYEKIKVPAPNLCPTCRFKRRAQFRNEMALYNRKCDLCGEEIISMYNPKSPYTVYCNSCWESDKWDTYEYGIGYDFSRPFFSQFKELMEKVPKKAMAITTAAGPNINSDYTNVAGGNKNCYLIFNAGKNEDCMYARGILSCVEVVDMYFSDKSERCYEGVNVQQSSGIVFGQNVSGCLDAWFIRDANGCQDCFGCVNLRNKSRYFLNQPLSRDEYRRKIEEVKGSYSKMNEFKYVFDKLALKYPRRENNNIRTSNSAGEYLFGCNNISDSFEVTNSESGKYLFSVKMAKDSYDLIGYGYNSELLLECVATGYASRIIGTYCAEESQDIAYCFLVRGCNHMVGCDGVKKGEYCILNKKYPKEEYKKLAEHIVSELKQSGDYGLFFPPSVAPFGYNETVAQDNMPLTKEEALLQNFKWQDELQITKSMETMRSEAIPDHIKDVKDSITNEILRCVACSRNYKITISELAFYRKMILPIPRKCFYCRHQDRIRRRGPFRLYDRKCVRCDKSIRTNYAPERSEIVYCEQCYNAEVV